jgi:hypothetical protein
MDVVGVFVRFRRLADAAVDLNDVIKIDSFSYRI